MANAANIKLYSVVIDCADPQALAGFYAKLMNWQVVYGTEEFVIVGVPGAAQGAYPGLTFQKNPDYRRPVWPEKPGEQQQMEHLDFAVDNLEAAVAHAEACGAAQASEQFAQHWRVMIDPEGHPFCLCDMKPVMESPDFALL